MEKIYENYTNYIYKVEPFDEMLTFDDRYILFNPSIFKWMSVDNIGKELFEEIRTYNDISVVKRHMVEKYGISEQVFDDDAKEFINQLLAEKYLSMSPTEHVAPWVGKTFNNSVVDNYYFDDIYVSLSEVCNLKCKYCFNDLKRSKRRHGNPLTAQEIFNLLREYKSIGGRGVVFTGGEPTINTEFINICKEAKRMGLRTTVITNGTLLIRYSLSDIVSCIDGITLSIDSTDDNIQQGLWNDDLYSFSKDVFPFLRELNEYVKLNGIKYSVYIMPVVNKRNIDCLNGLFQDIENVLKDCDVKWVFSKYSNIGNELIDNDLAISEKEYRVAMWTNFRGIIPDKELLSFIMDKGGKEYLADTPHKIACSPSFFVTNYGDIYPCQGLEECAYLLGNAHNDSLKTIFYGEKFQKLLMSIRVENLSECKDCELNMYCSNTKGRLCVKEMDSECKIKIVQRMFLKTMK